MKLEFENFDQNNKFDEKKRAFMRSFVEEAGNLKSSKETMAYMRLKLQQAREAGIGFTNDDVLLLATYLKQNATPGEMEMIQQILSRSNIPNHP